MGMYVKTTSGLFPIATVAGADVTQLVDDFAFRLADEDDPLYKEFARLFVRYTDQDGEQLPPNSTFKLMINPGDGTVDMSQNMPVNSDNVDLTINKAYLLWVFTGTTATWTLPTTTGRAIGEEFYVKNSGSGNLTLQRGGTDQLYSTSAVNSITVAAGGIAHVVWSGTYWLVL